MSTTTTDKIFNDNIFKDKVFKDKIIRDNIFKDNIFKDKVRANNLMRQLSNLWFPGMEAEILNTLARNLNSLPLISTDIFWGPAS